MKMKITFGIISSSKLEESNISKSICTKCSDLGETLMFSIDSNLAKFSNYLFLKG